MPRINYVKKCRIDQGSCGRCGDPLPAGSAYRWIKKAYSYKQVRCMKASCMFRQSDLTSSDKLQRVYAAGEYIEDALERFVLEVHVSEILENGREIASAVEESMSELEDVAMEYEESADNLEEYFSGSYQIDEIREKAYGIESWRDEFETAKDDLESALEELETYISQVEAYREEHDPPEDADLIVTTVEGLTDLMFDEEGNIEPFDTASIETAIESIRDQSGSCPI